MFVCCDRGWVVYFVVMVLLLSAAFMLLTRLTNQGKPVTEVKVSSPPSMNTMEQLLAVQNAISKVEELVQDANIVLLKIRALLLAFPSQVTILTLFSKCHLKIYFVLHLCFFALYYIIWAIVY